MPDVNVATGSGAVGFPFAVCGSSLTIGEDAIHMYFPSYDIAPAVPDESEKEIELYVLPDGEISYIWVPLPATQMLVPSYARIPTPVKLPDTGVWVEPFNKTSTELLLLHATQMLGCTFESDAMPIGPVQAAARVTEVPVVPLAGIFVRVLLA